MQNNNNKMTAQNMEDDIKQYVDDQDYGALIKIFDGRFDEIEISYKANFYFTILKLFTSYFQVNDCHACEQNITSHSYRYFNGNYSKYHGHKCSNTNVFGIFAFIDSLYHSLTLPVELFYLANYGKNLKQHEFKELISHHLLHQLTNVAKQLENLCWD
jgi:hypothetical protein